MRAGSYSYNDVRYSRCIFIEDRNIGEPSNSHYELHAYLLIPGNGEPFRLSLWRTRKHCGRMVRSIELLVSKECAEDV